MANFLKSLFVKGVEIDTTGASTGNVLSYNGSKFAPATPGSGSLALNDLSDVVVASPEEFQGLSYNGVSWINSHIPLVSYVRNAESTTITTGTCVYLFGATGDHATVKRADNNNDTTSSKTIGVAGADITASNNGPIVTRGYVDGIDLSTGYTAGDVLWLGENGAFTTTKPTAPDHLVFIGVVVRATNNGIIYVATQNGYELDELHNVSLPSPNSGEFLKYNGSLWVADAIDLGTDTTGNYMSGVSAGTGISVSHTPSEGSTATISVDTTYSGFVPAGTVVAYAGTVIPTGWLQCDGTEVSRTTYSALWNALGTTSSAWGQGNGVTTFNVPNMSSKLPYGGTSAAAVPTVTISANTDHNHTANSGNQSAAHSHTISSNSGNQSAAHSHNISSNAGNVSADHSHNWGNNTGYVSNGHTHNYTDYYGNAAATKTTNDINQNHYHYVGGTTSGISTNHNHGITSNASNENANHSHAITSNAGTESATHNHVITVAPTSSMTHSHTLPVQQFIYIIKV